MQCCVLNVTNGLRCLNRAAPGLNICGLHRSRTVPHELEYCGEEDTYYRDPEFASAFHNRRKKVVFDASREHWAELDPEVTKPRQVMHPFHGLPVKVRYIDNNNYMARVVKVMKHSDGTHWCHIKYYQDGSTQDIKTSEFKMKNADMLRVKL